MRKYVSLNDVCFKITDGSHNPPSGVDVGLPMLSSRNITKTGLTLDGARYLSKQDYDRENKRTDIQPNDILITIVGTVGRVYVVNDSDPKFTIQRSVGVLKPKKEMISSNFLGCLIKSDHFQRQLTKGAKGVAQKGIYLNDIKKLQIPLPPLPEQKRIADLLDAADSLRQKDKALLRKYDQLAQSLFLEMFGDPVKNEKGWKETTLSEITEITSSRRIFQEEYVSAGIPFYRTKEIVELSKGIPIKTELFISESRYLEIKLKNDIPKIGDILLSAVGTIGVMWVVSNSEPFYFKDGNIVWLKSSKSGGLNSTYLKMTLGYLIEADKANLAQGAAYNALTIDKLKRFKVCLAPISLQNQFAEKVQLIEKQKELAKKNLEKSEALFGALMGEVFGEKNMTN